MIKKMETLIKVLEKSIEISSNDEDVLLWLALELEWHRFDLGNPRVGIPRGEHLHLNGFGGRRNAEDCASWIRELLINDDWEEDPRADRPRNETWYKKQMLRIRVN